MLTKTRAKRNLSCSCGSGKKYKRCCLPTTKKRSCVSFSPVFSIPGMSSSSKATTREMKYRECRECNHARSSGSCRIGI